MTGLPGHFPGCVRYELSNLYAADWCDCAQMRDAGEVPPSEQPASDTHTEVFHVPPQILLHPEVDNMLHDHALGLAHAKGLIPVGPILIEHKLVQRTGLSLQEGVAMGVNSLETLAATAAGLGMEVVEVTASMLIGSKL